MRSGNTAYLWNISECRIVQDRARVFFIGGTDNAKNKEDTDNTGSC